MRHCHYTITAPQVHRLASDRLQTHLQLTDHGPRCSAAVVLRVVLWAAARVSSLAAACAALTKAPSDQAVRDALVATLPELELLQRRLNRALSAGLPRRLVRRGQFVAIDLTLIPYYGRHQNKPEELYRGAPKAGTRTSHAYATAYVCLPGCRYSLALRVVHHSDPWQEVVADLLRQVRRAGVKVRCLLLDRGFYSVAVIRYLQSARCPFVMPVVRHGRKPCHPEGPSGTWELTTRKRSGWVRHTLEERRRRGRVTVDVAVCRHRLPEETRCGRRLPGRRPGVWLYAVWGLDAPSVRRVRDSYRRRFGIETSYRQLHQGRLRTSSRSPLLRLLAVGVALVLRNVWVWLHWEVLAKKRRGGRRVELDQLPLRAMLHWLQIAIETLLGVKESVPSQRPYRE